MRHLSRWTTAAFGDVHLPASEPPEKPSSTHFEPQINIAQRSRNPTGTGRGTGRALPGCTD
jgi:hypothetical protein